MKSKKQIKLSPKDLEVIYGQDYRLFRDKIIPNCYCPQCKTPYTSTIIDYTAYLNDLNDIILKGCCAECQSLMNRYLETGEVPKYVRRIKKLLAKKGEV